MPQGEPSGIPSLAYGEVHAVRCGKKSLFLAGAMDATIFFSVTDNRINNGMLVFMDGEVLGKGMEAENLLHEAALVAAAREECGEKFGLTIATASH